MGTAPVSARDVASPDCDDQAMIRRFEGEWSSVRSELETYRTGSDRVGSVSRLAMLVKVDLRGRYDRGERPAAAEYLERFPELSASGERVLSLVYEEYCLREERDGRPDTAEFCARYEPWKDSLESQLRYHRVLSRVVGSAPPPPRFPTAGERFGPFLIGNELGRGGAGRVYLARDESLGGREVALKVSHDRGSEPATMGRLKHPHIVPVHSVVFEERDGTTLRGLCMAYLPGLPLDEVIRRVAPATRPALAGVLQEALRTRSAVGEPGPGGPGWETFPARGSYAEGVAWVVARLADALRHAHEQEVYHRDVKPANVLLTYLEGPQLLDFNLSHDPHSAVEAEAALRGGTLPYMAPEQLKAFLDPARWCDVVGPADLYSLGLVLRELLTGRAPETPDPALPLPRAIRAMLDQRAADQIDLRQVNPTIPHALEAIAAHCLAYDPADRYRDAAALAEDLRRFLGRCALKYAHNGSVRERGVNRLVRHRAPLSAVVLSAVVLSASFGVVRSIQRQPELAEVASALDADQAGTAIEILKRMNPRLRDSAIAVFYRAAALARTGQMDGADAALQQFWARPGAEGELTLWARSHPSLAHQAETLGGAILTDAPRLGGSLKAARLDRVEQTLGLVLRLDPKSFWARQGLAVIEEGRQRYDAAHEAQSAVIAWIGTPRTMEDRRRLTKSLMARARVSAQRARALPLGKRGESSPRAESYLKEALGDLERCDRWIVADQHVMKFELNFIRCETILALANAASAGGRYSEALALYEQAGRVLDALADHPASRDSEYRALETKVRDRLRTEPARLKSLIDPDSPRPGQ